jgi:hypothetical protein
MNTEVQLAEGLPRTYFRAQDSIYGYLTVRDRAGASIFEIKNNAKRVSSWKYPSVSAALP